MHKFKRFIWLSLIVVILIVINIFWLHTDTRPPHWDSGTHLSNSLNFFTFLKNHDFGNFFFYYANYPPFTYYVSAIAYAFFGKTEIAGILSLSPFLLILIFSTYKLGNILLNEKLGFLAVIAVIGLPFLMSQTREYQLDYPLTAMVILNLYLFIKSDYFTLRKYSLLFGITSGLGLLTKWTYVVFFACMLVMGLLEYLSGKNIKGKVIKNICYIFAEVLIIAGPWYFFNISKLWLGLKGNISISIEEHDPAVLSRDSLFWYFKSLYFQHLRFPYLLLFIFSIVSLRISALPKKIKSIATASFIYFMIMTLYRNKDGRFIEPLTPVISIIFSYWILTIQNKVIRIILIFFLVGVSAFNFISSTFGLPFLPERFEIHVLNQPLLIYYQQGYTLGPPKKENWYVEEIIERIKTLEKEYTSPIENPKNNQILLIVDQDKMFFNENNFTYFVKLDLDNTLINQIQMNHSPCSISKYYYKFLIINVGSKNNLQLCDIPYYRNYYKLGDFMLPDSSHALILQHLDI